MKKHLLLLLGVGVCLNSSAQNQATRENTSRQQQNKIDNNPNIGFFATSTKPLISSGNRAVTKTKIGSSWNAYTLLVSESNCLTANQATNTIMFTHRINNTWAAPNVNSGFIQSTYSFDGGVTWDSLLQVQEAAPNLCRYPSGAIFNPTNNTIPGNAFSVVSGPITNGTLWAGNFFASTKLDKTNKDPKIQLNATVGVPYQDFARIGIQSTDDKVVVTGGLHKGDPALTTAVFRGATINYAKLNGSNFTWTIDSIKPDFKINPLKLTAYASTQPSSAWSKDGNTGYLVFVGIENSATGNNLSYQPLVWKTINGGTSWSKLPSFDYSALPSVAPYLKFAGDGVTKKAFYSAQNGMDATVDINGNLHILSTILSAYTVNPDSLDYVFNPLVSTDGSRISYIYDTHTTGSTWDATLIDSLRTIPAEANTPFADGAGLKYFVDARMQISKSADGSHIFYMWMDSEIGSTGENFAPDIFGKGFNVSTNLYTPTTQFTFDAGNYYMYTSDIALVNGNTYTIPTTISLSQDGTNNTENPFDHYYVSGIQFKESDFVGINEITEKGNLTISQNYPNPFDKSTSIDLTLKESSNVSIEVYNTLGQNVLSQKYERLNMGTHTININGSVLTTGIYFYTVKTNDVSVTRKMIVQ